METALSALREQQETSASVSTCGRELRRAKFGMIQRIALLLILGTGWSFAADGFLIEEEQFTNHIGVIYDRIGKPIGSGFVFGKRKHVVTCAHVVAQQDVYSFLARNALHRSLTLKYALPKYDLAVLSASPEIPGTSVSLGDFKRMRPGDWIVYAGWDTQKNAFVMNSANVSAIGSALNEGVVVDFLEFEGEGRPGYSGGPVFNGRGELVALMREAWTKTGVKGGSPILINRAFSIEILSVVDSQIYGPKANSSPTSTNKSSITLTTELEKVEIK